MVAPGREHGGGLADPLDGRQRDHDGGRVPVLDRGFEHGAVAAAGEDGIRGRQAGERAGRVSVDDPRADVVPAAFRRILSHWAWSASTAITWAPNRAHSTATEPEPAPTSQIVRPGPGPSRASTSARTSDLVIMESRWSKASSGRAQPSGAPWCPASQRGSPGASSGSRAMRTLGSAGS